MGIFLSLVILWGGANFQKYFDIVDTLPLNIPPPLRTEFPQQLIFKDSSLCFWTFQKPAEIYRTNAFFLVSTSGDTLDVFPIKGNRLLNIKFQYFKKGKVYSVESRFPFFHVLDVSKESLMTFTIDTNYASPCPPTYQIKTSPGLSLIYISGHFFERIKDSITKNYWMHLYRSDGKFLKMFFRFSPYAERNSIYSIGGRIYFDVSENGKIYAVESSSYEIYEFDSLGNSIKTFGVPPSDWVEYQDIPKDILFSPSSEEHDSLSNYWRTGKMQTMGIFSWKDKVILCFKKCLDKPIIEKEIAPGYKLIKSFEDGCLLQVYDEDGNKITEDIFFPFAYLLTIYKGIFYFAYPVKGKVFWVALRPKRF